MGNNSIMLSIAALIIAGVQLVRAESHTIRFNNQCGMGTPQLVIGGKILSNGEDWTSYGPAQSGIAYLQTGPCLLNGENCALLEYNLNNPTCPGCGSSVDISLIPPHALNVPVAFSFFNGCDGQGAICTTPDCNTAFHKSDDNQVQVACQEDNVNLLITFCPNNPPVAPAPAQKLPQSSNVQSNATASTTSYSESPSPSKSPSPSGSPSPSESPSPSKSPSHSESPSHISSLAPYTSKPSTSVAPPAEPKVVSHPTSPPPPPLPSTFHKGNAVPAPKPSTGVNVGKSAGKPSGKTCKRRRGHHTHGHSLLCAHA